MRSAARGTLTATASLRRSLSVSASSLHSGAPPASVPLKRPRQTMPAAVRRALAERGLDEAYRARPPHQRNDYLAWIKRAKREETREKRLAQMLDELASGDAYMGMAYEAKRAASWTCPQCGRSFRARNARHSCVSQSPEALFAEYPDALPLYRAVRAALERLGPVETEATRTQVAFRADRRFAFLWIPRMSLKRGPSDLYLTFDLVRPLGSPRLKEAVESHPGVWTHHMRLASRKDLDAEARAWLREAYETRGLE